MTRSSRLHYLLTPALICTSFAWAQEPSKTPSPLPPAPPEQTKAAPAPVPVRVAPQPPRSGPASEEVRASHILVGTQEEAEKVRKEIVEKGSDRKAFTTAARQHSKDVSTKILGGDLGYFSTGSGFDKAFADEAFRLKAGELSQPVKSSFGWHLIYVTDRREKATALPKDPVPPAKKDTGHTTPAGPNPVSPSPQQTATPGTPAKAAGPDQLAPPPTPVPVAPPPTPGAPAQPQTPVTAVAPVAPAAPVEPKRRPLKDQGLRISLETVRTSELSMDQFMFAREQAVEVNVIVKNEGSKEQAFFARELIPLGLRVRGLGEKDPIPGDFTAMAEPANLVVVLKPYEIMGLEISLNDYWKTLPPRRYGLNWDSELFLANLEKRFPNAKSLPDFPGISAFLKKRFMVQADVVTREVSPRIIYQRSKDLAFSVFEQLDPNKKYYAQIKLPGEQPVIIQLYTKEQFRAARHFANLVLNGFYDGLDFFEVEKGDFLLGGCPIRTGTGAPSSMLPMLRNDGKLDHKRGVVSMVSRSVRSKGPAMGGQVGSIFVICLKDHPEWNDEHVPVGQITAGIEVLDKLGQSAGFSEITLLTEDQLGTVASAAPATPGAASNVTTGNPEAVIKTSKGEITVELFEDVARNTVANFVNLAEQKFYDKDAAGSGKQKFFITKDQNGKPVLAQTGSPKNDFESGPGYHIADEPNAKKHIKGALVMVMQYDERTKGYVPNTAGSQFFICLADIPSYDFQEKKPTIFGQVKGGMEVLDKLLEGDTIESVTIAKKKSHQYAVNKIPTP